MLCLHCCHTSGRGGLGCAVFPAGRTVQRLLTTCLPRTGRSLWRERLSSPSRSPTRMPDCAARKTNKLASTCGMYLIKCKNKLIRIGLLPVSEGLAHSAVTPLAPEVCADGELAAVHFVHLLLLPGDLLPSRYLCFRGPGAIPCL